MQFVQMLFEFDPEDVCENERRRIERMRRFSEFIRSSGFIPRDALTVIAIRDYDLWFTDVDQCVADAFNPMKGYVDRSSCEDLNVDSSAIDSVLRRTCLEYNDAFPRDVSPARKSSSFNQDLISSLRCAVGMKMYPNDPDPQYPRWVVVLCVILTIVLFLWGFFRG